MASTPQRPLPGAFLETPAVGGYRAVTVPQPPAFRSTSSSSVSRTATKEQASSSQQALATSPSPVNLSPLERAARTINETLSREARYPEIDSYIGQGISSDYDIPVSLAWAPFQKTKIYEIPDRVFEQYNKAQVSTTMGLFAELNHAWITIDNALYLWDYTQANPELIGFEEQPYNITAVKLVIPRQGVFVPAITHLLVVATTADMILIGLSCQPGPGGSKSVSLYQTRMSLSTKGMEISTIEGSSATGRIFFAGRGDNDVYELTYQQEEKWFQNRCGKINHTTKGLAALAPGIMFAHNSSEHIVQMAIDDSRNLLYTLSSSSNIRAFQLKPNQGLEFAVVQPLSETFSNINHMLMTKSELLGHGMIIVSISPISSREANKLYLMATTSTGCRLFLSATASYGYMTSNASGKLSMQVQHVKFPPPQQSHSNTQQQTTATQALSYSNTTVDTNSKALTTTRKANRFPPGFSFCFVPKDSQGQAHTVFASAPDSGRIARPQDSNQMMPTKFREHAVWFDLDSYAEDIGVVSPPFGAASTPVGFGNELAVQFDKPVSELAILTTTGVHIVRRRRLVDIFATVIQTSGGEEALEVEARKFVQQYGRSETCATALAVACGQGLDVSDSRNPKHADPTVLAYAREAFIKQGGKPMLNENTVLDLPTIDNVKPSSRHEGIALYISRLVRSIWRETVIREGVSPLGGLSVGPSVSLQKLQDIQRDLTKLKEFLDTNKSFIDGLTGSEALTRVGTQQEVIALQAEHRALHSLVVLIADIIEGISFVLVLFDERVDEIVLSLSDMWRKQMRELTFSGLFASKGGKDLAKELVKAIVNRNIANGSNVDTIAEALRRRCGSFCSADDVVIFKAQEQLKKAGEAGGSSDFGRRLLNESLRLFQQVAASLTMEQLQWAIEQYIIMEFFAGAIQLALSVAKESDRANDALGWIRDGRLRSDPREAAFHKRARTYDLVHQVISSVDKISQQGPDMIDGSFTSIAKRRNEAYAEIDNSDDEVFQNNLYDWYLAQAWTDRLLAVKSSYVVPYLQHKAMGSPAHADLLWTYHAQASRYHDAAEVQLQLAKSDFNLSLDKRIEYLSKAKANESTPTLGVGRRSAQVLRHEITELLEVANIQGDLLTRLKADERISRDKRAEVVAKLDGQLLPLSDLYNLYADPGSYYDICLLIYHAADHRNVADVQSTWKNLLEQTHQETVEKGEGVPYEAVAGRVRTLGNRLNLSDSTFPIAVLVPMLETYAFEHQRRVGPATWVMDTFLDLQVPYEALLPVLEGMFYNNEVPFTGRNRRVIGNDILYVCQRWYDSSLKSGGRIYGGEGNAVAISHTLQIMMSSELDADKVEGCRALKARIEAYI